MLAERTSSKLSTGGGPATVQSDVFGPFLRTARLGSARTGTIRLRGESRLREPPPPRDFSGSAAPPDTSLYTPAANSLLIPSKSTSNIETIRGFPTLRR